MNEKKISVLFLIVIALNVSADIKKEYEKMKEATFAEYNKARDNAIQEYETARRKANEEFAKFMEQPWEPAKIKPVEKSPVIPSPDPVIIDADTVKPVAPKPVVISEITPIPAPAPQPQPIEPIKEIKEEKKVPTMTVNLYGTDFSLRKPDFSGFRLSGTSGSDISKAWKWLNNDRTNNLIKDCLKLRNDKNLCDWAYLKLLQRIAETLTGERANTSKLLTGFLFSQSGYKMRFATDSRKNLHVFYNPTGIVYKKPALIIDGERFYRLDEKSSEGESYEICNFKFPGEKSLNFEILSPLLLDYAPSPTRSVTVHNYPTIKMDVAVNKNLISFYNEYPDATITHDPYSKWAIHANTPASKEIQENIYPVLRDAVKGKTQKEAVNILLKLAQSFEYGYDDEIWGRDRAFFMDESWNYPLSDCEDHAINFSRIVRDIMGLDVALVYYPGHLATAVAFTDPDVTGDYIEYKGRRYIVCDPTIFYSNIGMTMRGMNNSKAILVPLR